MVRVYLADCTDKLVSCPVLLSAGGVVYTPAVGATHHLPRLMAVKAVPVMATTVLQASDMHHISTASMQQTV